VKKMPIDVQFRVLVIKMLSHLLAATVCNQTYFIHSGELGRTIDHAHTWLDEVDKDYR